jgi:hypothetical protein
LIQKNNFFSAVIFFQLLVIKALDPDPYWNGIQLKMLDPDPGEMNADPQPCFDLKPGGKWVEGVGERRSKKPHLSIQHT